MGICSSSSPKENSSQTANKYKTTNTNTVKDQKTLNEISNIAKPEGLENLEPLDGQLFHLQVMVTVACQNSEGKWLLTKDSETNKLNFIGGQANPPEDFFVAAINRFKEQVGYETLIIGMLKMGYSIHPEHHFQRMKAILYAKVPEAPRTQAKKKIDKSLLKKVVYMSGKEIMKEYEKGGSDIEKEVYDWVNYVENKGMIYPLTVLTKEGAKVTKSSKAKGKC